MKRITIRRNRKQVVQTQPPVAAPEPEPEDEASEYSSSESFQETEPPTEAIRDLRVDDQPKPRPQTHFERRADPVRRTTFAQPLTEHVPQQQNRRYHVPKPSRQLGRPRSIEYEKPLENRYGRPKMRWGSHFGPNGAYMDTQTKARLLYSNCFG